MVPLFDWPDAFRLPGESQPTVVREDSSVKDISLFLSVTACRDFQESRRAVFIDKRNRGQVEISGIKQEVSWSYVVRVSMVPGVGRWLIQEWCGGECWYAGQYVEKAWGSDESSGSPGSSGKAETLIRQQ